MPSRTRPPRGACYGRTVSLRTVFASLACVIASVPLAASAQSTPERGWALDRYDPAPAGDRSLLAEHPRYARRWDAAASLTFELGTSTLRVQRTYADTHTDHVAVLSSMLVAQLNAAASFAGRVGVDVSLPISLAQDGSEALLGTIVLAPASGVAAGDLRLGGRVRLVGFASRDPFSVHLGAWVWLPTGSRVNNTGDGVVRASPRVVLAGAAGVVRWSLTTSLMFRRPIDALNVAVGTELRFTGGVSFDVWQGRMRVGPEAYVVTPIRDVPEGAASAAFAQGQWGAELLLGAHVALPSGLSLDLGGGMGFDRGVGVPGARAALGVSWRGSSVSNEPAAVSER